MNLTYTDPKEIVSRFTTELDKLGLEYSVAHSTTDFGNSSYIYVGKFKIRASDHSTGIGRMLSEEPLFDLTFKQILEDVERHFFPERFEQVFEMKFGHPHFKTESQLLALPYEYEIVDPSQSFVSSKGNLMHYVHVKNDKITYFVRKQSV